MTFSFERLTVYKMSLELVEKVEELCKSLKGKLDFEVLF